MTRILGIALAILASHAFAAGGSTLDDMPAPARSILVHAYQLDNDPDRYAALFVEPAVIDTLPGVIVTVRINDGQEAQDEKHRFFLPGSDVQSCKDGKTTLRHAFGGKIVGDESWRMVMPVEWNDRQRPPRRYAQETTLIDIIGTELCVAHYASFSDDLQKRVEAQMAERSRKGAEESARHEADVVALKACLDDHAELERSGASNESASRELSATADRLAIVRAGLDVQRTMIESYQASASSRNEYNRQVRAYETSAADFDRQAKAHRRVVERFQAAVASVDARCSNREFTGTAVQQVCRTNNSEYCAKANAGR